MTDAKIKRNFVSGIIEDTLTKKPYAKIYAGLLFENKFLNVVDPTKAAIECLKNLISEDFMQLAQAESERMAEYEKKYKNIQGNTFESELSKIVLRYQTEGK